MGSYFCGAAKRLFRTHRVLRPVECPHERVPAQGGALDASRVFGDAAEDGEFAQLVGVIRIALDQFVKATEEVFRVLDGLTKDGFGHDGK